MEILYLILFSLPVLIGYLYLNKYIRKKGDTSKKRTAFRVAVYTHGVALALIMLSAILLQKGVLLRWGLSWYISYAVILSGVAMYMSVPKHNVCYLWHRLYSGIYYWGIAVCIPFWFLMLLFVGVTFKGSRIFENRKFSIYDTSLGTVHPKDHQNVIYKNNGLFLKELTSFEYDGMIWKIQDVAIKGGNTIQVYLKEKQTDSSEVARDSVLTIRIESKL